MEERRLSIYCLFLLTTSSVQLKVSRGLSRENLARVINTFNGQSARLSRGNMCKNTVDKKNKNGSILDKTE